MAVVSMENPTARTSLINWGEVPDVLGADVTLQEYYQANQLEQHLGAIQNGAVLSDDHPAHTEPYYYRKLDDKASELAAKIDHLERDGYRAPWQPNSDRLDFIRQQTRIKELVRSEEGARILRAHGARLYEDSVHISQVVVDNQTPIAIEIKPVDPEVTAELLVPTVWPEKVEQLQGDADGGEELVADVIDLASERRRRAGRLRKAAAVVGAAAVAALLLVGVGKAHTDPELAAAESPMELSVSVPKIPLITEHSSSQDTSTTVDVLSRVDQPPVSEFAPQASSSTPKTTRAVVPSNKASVPTTTATTILRPTTTVTTQPPVTNRAETSSTTLPVRSTTTRPAPLPCAPASSTTLPTNHEALQAAQANYAVSISANCDSATGVARS